MKNKELTFWGHLEEFRQMLFRMIIALAALMVVVFLFKSFVFDTLILSPRSSDFILYRWLCALNNQFSWADLCPEPFHIDLININLSSQFIIHLSTSFWIALILGFPYLIWELWRFIAPALYPKEQRSIKRAFIFSSLLFYAGVTVAYLMIFPFALHFLGGYQVSAEVKNQISLQSYIGTLTSLVLAMGIVFEFPVLIHILSRIGVVNRAMLRKYRRHAIVVLLILAAIITPADIFSMILAAVPLYLLYEISILTCKEAKN
ncbi:MAG: twin-arginine translocase subunit TatC [Prevotellaceae bacterium]|jgi:sec-independent protein translocase protein TatC|nr:twin-arginine translocase subunit TatC [Prevotellaceae bacterium]